MHPGMHIGFNLVRRRIYSLYEHIARPYRSQQYIPEYPTIWRRLPDPPPRIQDVPAPLDRVDQKWSPVDDFGAK